VAYTRLHYDVRTFTVDIAHRVLAKLSWLLSAMNCTAYRVGNAEPIRHVKNIKKGEVSMVHQHEDERSAFCATCPQPTDVSKILVSLGCSLAFSMPAEDEGAYMDLPPLPAQFHYEGPGSLRVIYLVGPDIALDGERFPEHQSRFWLSGDHTQAAFQQVASKLSVRWSLHWQRCGSTPASLEEVA
jgi:hypothetical protein